MASSSVAISRGGRRALRLYFAGFLAFLYVPLALMLGLSFGENFSGLRINHHDGAFAILQLIEGGALQIVINC